MEICKLYEATKLWETALTLIKPRAVTMIRVSPMIEDDIQRMGEGDIYSYFKVYVETENQYTNFIMGDDITHYKDDKEKKWVEESQIYLLIEYIEDRMSGDYLNNFWKDFPWDVVWKPLSSISSSL